MGDSVSRDAHELSELARRHLWMHFSRLGAYASDHDVPIIASGEGCYVTDAIGKRYLDALSGLFTVQVGHGRPELAAAAARQAETLEYFPIWTYAHPPAIELAARLADLAPGDLNRVFFTTGGSEAVESAWKLARQYFRAIGQEKRYKVISREVAYHGTTLGALAITGVPALREPFEPLPAGVVHVPNTNRYRHPLAGDESAFLDAVTRPIEEAIESEGPDTVAAVYLEPVQNAGGCIVPPSGYFARVREICDRHGVLLVSDEVICAFGRLGDWFGAQTFDYQPDMITVAKGLTSGYSPLGGVLCSDRLAEPFLEPRASFLHGITFGGHPVSCAVAMANLDIFEREDLCGHVRAKEGEFRAALESLGDLPIVWNPGRRKWEVVRGRWLRVLFGDRLPKGQFDVGLFASVGTPAYYVHPGEASHGDLGMIAPGDTVLALSNSGETGELADLVDYCKRFGVRLVAVTGKATSSLAEAADIVLALPGAAEACPLGLAPTTSTTMTLALGDALAVALLERRGFTSEDFQVLHPGGRLGRKLLRVADIMHTGAEMPLAGPDRPMADVLIEMTAKRHGHCGIVDEAGRLVGIVTDGDLRRHMGDGLLAVWGVPDHQTDHAERALRAAIDMRKKLDEINAEFDTADVALVIGANDVVNPAARSDPASPIYGMPILDVDKAASIVVMKRSMAPGFAGIDNELFLDQKTTMLIGAVKAL